MHRINCCQIEAMGFCVIFSTVSLFYSEEKKEAGIVVGIIFVMASRLFSWLSPLSLTFLFSTGKTLGVLHNL